MKLATENIPAIRGVLHAPQKLLARCAKGLIPQVVSIAVQPHDPEIRPATIKARLVTRRIGSRRSSQEKSTVRCLVNALETIIIVPSEGFVPEFIPICIQTYDP